MITSLDILKSTNGLDGRKIHVYVSVDNTPTDTILNCLVCDQQLEKSVKLNAGQSQWVSIDHNVNGTCMIVVSDQKNPLVKVQKLLDLDV